VLQLPGCRFINGYGPTEATTFSICYPVEDLGALGTTVPIGRPIANTQIYVLDELMQPVPTAIPGELYIGGDGIGRGYLNNPALTADRFVPNPFGTPGARLYRTGDQARWKTNGLVEFLGRRDTQIKIRGFRIEPTEIEELLLAHKAVKQAVVLAREDIPGDRRLAAYVVGDRSASLELVGASDTLRHALVGEWETLYEETYRAQNGHVGPSFIGWNSSYTGEPIEHAQMHEWLTCTIERIRELHPKRVLEIGCGVGLLLQHLAPQCEVYIGTDFSGSALQQLRKWVSGVGDLKHVELLQRPAIDLDGFEPAFFDTIVLNSVAQYFPDIEYLVTVLEGAARLVCPGGRIFIGDVRNLGLLSMFHSGVQLSKAAANINVGQLRKRIIRAVAQEKELVIDPQFFSELPGRIPRVSAADTQLKSGRALNELTRYRYDVVLRVNDYIEMPPVVDIMDWSRSVGSPSKLQTILTERHGRGLRVVGIPNARLSSDAASQRLIESSDEQVEAAALRCQLAELRLGQADPEMFQELTHMHGYDISLQWSAPPKAHCFDVLFSPREYYRPTRTTVPGPAVSGRPWGAFANDPLEYGFRLQLIPELREYLKLRIPDYMVPAVWTVLNHMPLTSNGKVDRRELPTPQELRPEELGEYVSPRTDLQRTLAQIWAHVLRIDQVGLRDNFFELGGHSLLAMKLITEISERLHIFLSAGVVFRYPTLEQMALFLESTSHAGDKIPSSSGEIEFEERSF
jgi:ubiquinone/menaquinone biosynthesis C-methylase UbiE